MIKKDEKVGPRRFDMKHLRLERILGRKDVEVKKSLRKRRIAREIKRTDGTRNSIRTVCARYHDMAQESDFSFVHIATLGAEHCENRVLQGGMMATSERPALRVTWIRDDGAHDEVRYRVEVFGPPLFIPEYR
jgi:hypothetical protein